MRNILDLSAKELKKYLMNPNVYFPAYLPEYIDFGKVLKEANEILSGKNNPQDIKSIAKSKRKNKKGKLKKYNAIKCCEDVNYKFYINKGDRTSWRPITLMNPIIYVDLVNTFIKHWKEIRFRFICCFPDLLNIPSIKSDDTSSKIITDARNIRKHFECASIPPVGNKPRYFNTNKPIDKLTVSDINKLCISRWINGFERRTINESLNYDYCEETDISNCYGSIYTHSIAWALMGKNGAKSHSGHSYLGNLLDFKIRSMQNGQTNGIPQSNDVCNLIAEMVLGYCDRLLYKKIENIHISHYHIIRYRDDYRIFSDSKANVDLIVKALSEVLASMNMGLNESKTKPIADLTLGSLKPDKQYWLSKGICENNLSIQYLPKKLLMIKQLSNKYPNSGSVNSSLSKLYNQLKNYKGSFNNIVESIDIMSSIFIDNPKYSVICIAIINDLLEMIEKVKGKSIENDYIKEIINKFKKLNNASIAEIWMQRMSIWTISKFNYNFKLCSKVDDVYRYIESNEEPDFDGNFYMFVRKHDLNRKGLKIQIPEHVLQHTKLWDNSWMKQKYQNEFSEDIVNPVSLINLNRHIKLINIDPYGY